MWVTVVLGLVAAFSKSLLRYAGPFVAKILLFFGVTVVSYHLGVQPLLDLVKSSLDGLPVIALQVIGLCKADKAITMIFSALAVRGASRISFKRGASAS